MNRASDDAITAVLTFQELYFGRLPSIIERVMIGFTGNSDDRTIRITAFSDGGGTISTVLSSKITARNKRRAADVASLREMFNDNNTNGDILSHVALTKKTSLPSFIYLFFFQRQNKKSSRSGRHKKSELRSGSS